MYGVFYYNNWGCDCITFQKAFLKREDAISYIKTQIITDFETDDEIFKSISKADFDSHDVLYEDSVNCIYTNKNELHWNATGDVDLWQIIELK